jgi:hypothetical protein
MGNKYCRVGLLNIYGCNLISNANKANTAPARRCSKSTSECSSKQQQDPGGPPPCSTLQLLRPHLQLQALLLWLHGQLPPRQLPTRQRPPATGPAPPCQGGTSVGGGRQATSQAGGGRPREPAHLRAMLRSMLPRLPPPPPLAAHSTPSCSLAAQQQAAGCPATGPHRHPLQQQPPGRALAGQRGPPGQLATAPLRWRS